MPPIPTFSIIVPSFNAAEKLRRTLDSVLEQTTDYEILVIDGASTDHIVTVMEGYAVRFGSRLRFRTEPDAGVYDAMNKGIERASGRYLYFLGAGDALRDGALLKVEAQLPDHNGALLYGQVFVEQTNEIYGTPFTSLDLARHNIPHQATFYGRELFKKFGSYPLCYPALADHAFNMRIWRHAAKHYLPWIVADYEGNGISVFQRDGAFIRDQGRLAWKYLGPLPWMIFKLDPCLSQRSKDLLRSLRHGRTSKATPLNHSTDSETA